MKMIRKQIYLTPWQVEQLVALARQAGCPEAEIIRTALDAYLVARSELPKDHPLSSLAGIGASGKDGGDAENHDRTIYRC